MPDTRASTLALVAALAASVVPGCGDDSPGTVYPYEPDTTRVIGGGGANAEGDGEQEGAAGGTPVSSAAVGRTGVSEFETPDGDACLELFDCARPQDACGEGGTADVIVGENGEVLSTVCYPNRNYEVVELADEVEDPVLGNRQVIVLDGEDDGDDVIGDLVVEGNNVIIYGDGPDTSVIGGDLEIEKNNAIVRGVRIRGDATITKNNASLIYCAIEGDLTITGNNVNLALCDIFGNVTITGNNAVFVSNRVAGDQPVEGINLRCNDNWRFTDANDDGVVADDEVGEPVDCISRDTVVGDDPGLRTRTTPAP